jgi:carbonic anhydrase
MDRLFDGVREFNAKDFAEHRDLFESLGSGQSPHTLFIGCSDSRIVPNLITKTLPGELFVVRNVANIVPYYRESGEFLATTSAIEYALEALGVQNIVVCGHSNCGGCKALHAKPSELESIPHTRRWLELAHDARDRALEALGGEGEASAEGREARLEGMTEQLNVIEQLNHLLSYPQVVDRYVAGKLKIFGWYYVIETGEIFDYSAKERLFIKIE